jgi:hypothetical protein
VNICKNFEKNAYRPIWALKSTLIKCTALLKGHCLQDTGCASRVIEYDFSGGSLCSAKRERAVQVKRKKSFVTGSHSLKRYFAF